MSSDGTDNAASPPGGSAPQDGPAFVGNTTLFVDTQETQRPAYKLGLPPWNVPYKDFDFEDIVAELGATPQDAGPTQFDFLRYNLGKFFYRIPEECSDPDSLCYNPDNPVVGDPVFVNPLNHVQGQDLELTHEKLNPGVYSNNIGSSFFPSTTAQYEHLHTNLVFRDNTIIQVYFMSLEYIDSVTNGTGRMYLLGGPDDIWPSENQISMDSSDDWRGFIYSMTSPGLLGIPGTSLATFQGLGVAPLPLHSAEAGDEVKDATPPGNLHDHAFVFNSPAASSLQDSAANIRVLFANIKPVYNFSQPEYEAGTFGFDKTYVAFSSLAGDEDMPMEHVELYLPNFNVVLSERENSWNPENNDFTDAMADTFGWIHTTMMGRLPYNILRPLATTDNATGYTEIVGVSGNEYLNEWIRVFKEEQYNLLEVIDGNGIMYRQAVHKFKNIIFPLEAIKNENINTFKASFPFYNEIRFNTDVNTKVADILHAANLFLPLVSDYIAFTDPDISHSQPSPSSGLEDVAMESTPSLTTSLTAYEQQITAEGLQSTNYEALETQNFPLNENGVDVNQYYFNNYAIGIKNLHVGSNLVQNIKNAEPHLISVGSETFSDSEIEFLAENPLVQLIYKSMFQSLYIDFIKKNKRLYSDIVSGKTCYNETLFYKIKKKDADGNLIQTFYVLNDSQLDEATLIDTQIIYSKKYSYQIFAIQLVVGNRYKYESDRFASVDALAISNGYIRWRTDIEVTDDASVMLFEVPYTSPKTVYTQELPPTPPDVNFIPYRHKDNQVMISLNSSMDDYYDDYIPIFPEDIEKIQNAEIGQSGKVHFKSEGDITGFDMFRISEIDFPNGPSSYLDFGITGVGKKVTLSMANGAPSYIDDINPGIKYWYAFRTNDKKHGLSLTQSENAAVGPIYKYSNAPDFSNPTNIFEIQTINNDGAIYFTMRTYDISFFDKQKQIADRILTKSFRKYLMIKPSLEQAFINDDPEMGGIDFEAPPIKSSIKDYIEDLNDDASFIPLGTKEHSIFGFDPNSENEYNQFRVRLVSRKTGRKLDINLRFKKPALEK